MRTVKLLWSFHVPNLWGPDIIVERGTLVEALYSPSFPNHAAIRVPGYRPDVMVPRDYVTFDIEEGDEGCPRSTMDAPQQRRLVDSSALTAASS